MDKSSRPPNDILVISFSLCLPLLICLSVCPEDRLSQRQLAAQIMPAFLIHGGSFDQRLLGTFPLPSSG